MEDKTEEFDIVRLTEEGWIKSELALAREFPLTIIFNGQELVTLLCTPEELDYLAVGFLASEGFLQKREQIKRIMTDEVRGVVRVETTEEIAVSHDILFKRLITSGCGRGASFYSATDVTTQKITSQIKIAADDILDLMIAFQRRSEMYRTTHGVHSAAISNDKNILFASDDIGRHNAVDRVFGWCLMQEVPTTDKILLTTGRLTSEILHKAAKNTTPILTSIQVPTNLGVQIAEKLGITLIGDVRGKRRMTIYSNDWRIIR